MSKINETNYPRRTQANYEDTDMLVIQKAGGNTYTTRIEDLREDCQETLAPALDTMRENLATIEGSTASKAYAKGDFLVFGGRLCKAKTSIASGATLVLDTNIELDSVGDELSSLSSDLVDYHTSNLSFNSNGKYVFDDDIKCLSARVVGTGNYAIIIGNTNAKTVFILYNMEGTSFDRVTTQPTLNVEWWTQP
jgi:hypothetical protein